MGRAASTSAATATASFEDERLQRRLTQLHDQTGLARVQARRQQLDHVGVLAPVSSCWLTHGAWRNATHAATHDAMQQTAGHMGTIAGQQVHMHVHACMRGTQPAMTTYTGGGCRVRGTQ